VVTADGIWVVLKIESLTYPFEKDFFVGLSFELQGTVFMTWNENRFTVVNLIESSFKKPRTFPPLKEKWEITCFCDPKDSLFYSSRWQQQILT
jgi:hypothetical protein